MRGHTVRLEALAFACSRTLRALFIYSFYPDLKSEGKFRVAGLNRLRAKELSAAEVKRGLRRNVTGGGQNIIPTMSFYSPKVLFGARARACVYVRA